jgi:hypothetical protein
VDGSSSHKAAAAGGDEGGLKNNMALSAEVWLVTPISCDLLDARWRRTWDEWSKTKRLESASK